MSIKISPAVDFAYESLDSVQQRYKERLQEWIDSRAGRPQGDVPAELREMAERLGIATNHCEAVFELVTNQQRLEEAKEKLKVDSEAAAAARQSLKEAADEYEALRAPFEAAANRLEIAQDKNERARVELQDSKRDVSTRCPNAINAANLKIQIALGKKR